MWIFFYVQYILFAKKNDIFLSYSQKLLLIFSIFHTTCFHLLQFWRKWIEQLNWGFSIIIGKAYYLVISSFFRNSMRPEELSRLTNYDHLFIFISEFNKEFRNLECKIFLLMEAKKFFRYFLNKTLIITEILL